MFLIMRIDDSGNMPIPLGSWGHRDGGVPRIFAGFPIGWYHSPLVGLHFWHRTLLNCYMGPHIVFVAFGWHVGWYGLADDESPLDGR